MLSVEQELLYLTAFPEMGPPQLFIHLLACQDRAYVHLSQVKERKSPYS